MSRAVAGEAANVLKHTANVFGPVQWFRIGVAVALCVGLNYGCAYALRVRLGQYDPASILLNESPMRCMMMLAISLFGGCFVATAITRAQRRDAGIFCAFLSVAWLSSQGAGLREALIVSASPRAYLLLAGECCTLGGVVVAVLGVFDALTSNWRVNDDLIDEFTSSDDSIPAKILAFLMTLLIYLGVLMIVAQTDRKAQVIAATLIAGLLSTLLAHFVLSVKPSAWYFAAPLVAGIIGNLLVYWIDPGGWEIGLSRSWASPMARPLPIDHLASGIAGSLLGYWTSRQMQASGNEDTQ